jgi:hypothetical protein
MTDAGKKGGTARFFLFGIVAGILVSAAIVYDELGGSHGCGSWYSGFEKFVPDYSSTRTRQDGTFVLGFQNLAGSGVIVHNVTVFDGAAGNRYLCYATVGKTLARGERFESHLSGCGTRNVGDVYFLEVRVSYDTLVESEGRINGLEAGTIRAPAEP